jgi:hypothetical protein
MSHWFDEQAKKLADGELSRRSVLGRGAGIVGAMLIFGAGAAHAKDGRPNEPKNGGGPGGKNKTSKNTSESDEGGVLCGERSCEVGTICCETFACCTSGHCCPSGSQNACGQQQGQACQSGPDCCSGCCIGGTCATVSSCE